MFGGSILTGGDLLAKSFVCLLRKERRCGENPARLDEILQRNKKEKNELETGTIRKRETSGKSEKDPAVVTDSKTRKELYHGIWFMNRLIYIFS